MATYRGEEERSDGGRQLGFAGAVLFLAVLTLYTADTTQELIARAVQSSVLRPFIALQESLAESRVRGQRMEELVLQLDSLTSIVSTQSTLVEENRTLRELLVLSERAGPSFLPASVLRPGTPGSESMFLVDVGIEDGVQVGAPVVGPNGLVGVIRDVRRGNAVGMDWTHPEFRASSMTVDGINYGIVENRRGEFREADRLVLNGTAYNEHVPAGTRVVTSGLGRLPRGIPIGVIDGEADVQGTWLRSYFLRAMVEPGSITHVLVATGQGDAPMSGIFDPDSLSIEPGGPGR